jgi:hypothetical protein
MKLTENNVGSKLVGDWHDDLLEGVNVVGVAHARLGEGNVDRAVFIVRSAKAPRLEEIGTHNLRPSIAAARVETVAVAMNRNVKYVWVVPEGLLSSVACRSRERAGSAQKRDDRRGQKRTVVDIPAKVR